MACYVEEEVWKCPKHSTKRRRNGICPICLRERLVGLCPYCANVRPCACVASTTTSSPSFSFSRVIKGEPPFLPSRSAAIPSRNSEQVSNNNGHLVKTTSFFSILKRSKTKRCDQAAQKLGGDNRIEDFARMIARSRSVSAGRTGLGSGFRRADSDSSPAKRRFWHFPSPMNVFRSSKTPKVVVLDR